MTIDQFLEEFQDILQRDEAVNKDDKLEDYEEWDSMSMMACMVWFESAFSIKRSYSFYQEQKTVNDLLAVLGDKVA